MKKQIRGMLYNTNTSFEVAMADNRKDSDEAWYLERLYCTPKGEFFIVGLGGELTRWKEEIGIAPMDKEAAAFWVRQHKLKANIDRRDTWKQQS